MVLLLFTFVFVFCSFAKVPLLLDIIRFTQSNGDNNKRCFSVIVTALVFWTVYLFFQVKRKIFISQVYRLNNWFMSSLVTVGVLFFGEAREAVKACRVDLRLPSICTPFELKRELLKQFPQ